jgi:subfamily B ATP-binding cassette protein MsbA
MKEEKHYLSCLKKANIKGLLTKKRILGEFHNNFSGGELQRLAIARALYQDKDIILFDESFSGLDYEVKISIMKMLKMIKEKIIIIVTHDLSLCSYVDKVYLLKNRRLFLQKN